MAPCPARERFEPFSWCPRRLQLGASEAVAHAQAEAPAAAEARGLFTSGSEHFLAGRYREALADLERSNELHPSPNSTLLVARCLRELGEPVRALERFEAAEADARARASQGDDRYLQSAGAAASAAAALRASRGARQVHVRNAPAGTRVAVAGVTHDVGAEPLKVLVPPGEISVRVLRVDGGSETNVMTVAAGAQARLELDLRRDAPAPAPSPAEGSGSARPWALPAALVSGGVALVGLGAFTGFGLASQSLYDDLSRTCGGSGCGPEHRADADRGERYQLLANVGLAAGAVAAAAAVTFAVLAATAGPEARANTERRGVRVVPSPLGVTGVF